MAEKNTIQFQKAMSMHTFQSEFCTVEQCRGHSFFSVPLAAVLYMSTMWFEKILRTWDT